MTAGLRKIFTLALVAAAMGLAACSGGPKVATGAPPAAPTAMGEIEAIAELLQQGEAKDARKRLDKALKTDPMNPSLLVLLQGLTGDAKVDLGPTSYPHTVRAGETMPDLAQRFLGNRLKAYQLARYNDIDTPASLAPGRVLRIPGQPPRVAPAPRPAAPRATAPTPATPRAKPPAAAPAAPAPRAAPAANPAAAQRARSAGLAALNQGNVANAVTMLRRAAALDPGNAAIARDLARAERIAATVQSRR
ncbi:LysM peptidoglycan-binding domain-containing protein [Sphingomonas aestuarii]